jgi:hypothetical protein
MLGLDNPTQIDVAEPLPPTLYNEPIPDTFSLGWHYSEKKNQFQMAKISNDDRDSHFYIVGSTGVGKSKFLQYLILQDILNGRGVGVIDPHGDLIDDIKGLMAASFKEVGIEDALANRVIVIDPTDPDYTVAFNPLEKLPGVSAAEQASELVSSFKKIWADSWGVRMEDLMRNALISLCEAELTLVELSTFLTDRQFRESVMAKVNNPIAREYFNRFNVLTDRGQIPWIEPIMNKINAVFCDDRIKQIFAPTKSTFNLREAMDESKVIKLDKGRLKDSANLLGALLLAKIQMAAFSRSDVDREMRIPFYLYIDEFQNFANDSFALILSEARKYKLYVTMAHQSLAQISGELRDLILGCAGIQVYFRLGRSDAQTLAKEAFHYSGSWDENIGELQNLESRSCFVKNKIQGGIIRINAVTVNSACELLQMRDDVCARYIASLPFGHDYLLKRSTLASLADTRRIRIQEVAPRRIEKEATIPTPQLSRILRLPKPEPMPKFEAPKERVVVEVPPREERGKTQHQYLQSLIKRMAEEKGYKATLEQPTSDGGRVDVGLERNGKRVAVEITVTTTSEHELGNIEKCLKAGYDKVIVCSQGKKNLEKIRVLVMEKLEESGIEKVMFFEPDELLFYLEDEAAQDLYKEERVKGYKVKVNYQPVSSGDKKMKREAVAQVILGAFRRLKENG